MFGFEDSSIGSGSSLVNRLVRSVAVDLFDEDIFVKRYEISWIVYVWVLVSSDAVPHIGMRDGYLKC